MHTFLILIVVEWVHELPGHGVGGGGGAGGARDLVSCHVHWVVSHVNWRWHVTVLEGCPEGRGERWRVAEGGMRGGEEEDGVRER